jgi:hypothetical protein
MGQVGGNGSVVWKNKHVNGAGKTFKQKTGKGKLQVDELREGTGDLYVWGRDEVPLADIGKAAPPDLESGLTHFQEAGYFLVRLRFDGKDAQAIKDWFAAAPAAIPWNVKLVSQGNDNIVIMAVNVKAVNRPTWPSDDETFGDMPWEIRYDW